MKIKNLEVFIVLALFMFTFYLWSLPYQNNRMPYGEVDAGSHFGLGDYMAGTNKPITTLPYFIDMRYGFDNKFKPHTLWYHPPYHVNFAIMQIIGNERILPIFFLNTLLSSIIVLIIYFIMRNVFGFWPALLSSLLLIFSTRDIMVYLWGQWPQQIAYFYTPLVLYAFYKYTSSYLEKKEKPVYIYILSILLAVNFFFHPASFYHTLVSLIVFILLIFIKEKKLFFNIKHSSIAIILFILLIALFPYQTGNVLVKSTRAASSKNPYIGDFSTLFHWFGMEDYYKGRQPIEYYSYSAMIKIWTLPLLLLGIIYLLMRRKSKDLLLLSYLIGTYLMVHLIFFGFGRPERSLAATAHIFYPLIVLGLVFIPSLSNQFIKIPSSIKRSIKYILIIIFLILVFTYNYKPAYAQLKDSYQGIIRITPTQYNAAEWIKENLPEDANIVTLGTLTSQKIRWLRYISWRYMFDEENTNTPNYVMIDYSDLILLQNDPRFKPKLDHLQQYELTLENNTKLYDKNNIKVYSLEN